MNTCHMLDVSYLQTRSSSDPEFSMFHTCLSFPITRNACLQRLLPSSSHLRFSRSFLPCILTLKADREANFANGVGICMKRQFCKRRTWEVEIEIALVRCVDNIRLATWLASCGTIESHCNQVMFPQVQSTKLKGKRGQYVF